MRERNLSDQFEVASSGTGAWHIGQRPDRRMRRIALKHGVSLDHLRAQEFVSEDLRTYDYIFAMDRGNLYDVLSFDRTGRYKCKVQLFRSHDPIAAGDEVPDPYYSGRFDEVYAIVSRTCRAILEHLYSKAPTAARK